MFGCKLFAECTGLESMLWSSKTLVYFSYYHDNVVASFYTWELYSSFSYVFC